MNKNMMNAIAAWLWGVAMIVVILLRNRGVAWSDVRLSHLLTLFVGCVLVVAGFVYLILALTGSRGDRDPDA